METTQNTNVRKKSYRWALFVGLSLMIVFGFISLFVDTAPANRGPAVSLSIPAIISTCLIVPVLEELSYRLWCIRKKYALIVSFLLIAADLLINYTDSYLTDSPLQGIIISCAILIPLGYCFYQVPRKEIFTPILIVFTSIVFGGAHAFNWLDFTSLPAILMAISTIGFAMVACFLVLNYGIIWSILMHVVWNSLIIVLTLISSPQAKNIQVETDNYKMILKPYLWEAENSGYIGIDDTCTITTNLPSFCEGQLSQYMWDTVPYAMNTMYRADGDILSPQYIITLINKTPQEKMFAHKEAVDKLVRELERQHLLKLDTTYVPMNILTEAEGGLLTTADTNIHGTVTQVLTNLRSLYSVPVVLDNSINPECRVDDGSIELLFKLDSLEYIKHIENKCGLKIIPEPHSKMMIVTLSTPS